MEALEHYLAENFLRRRTYLHDHYVHIWRGTAREFEYHREDDPPRIWCTYAASLLLRAGSLRCAIDLSFRTGIFDRKALRLEETLPELDLFLLTHLHGDHYDPEVIRLLARRGRPRFVVPELLVRRVMEETGLHEYQILSVREGECIEWGGATVRAHPSPHGGMRHNFGYVLEVGGRRIVFTSDVRDYRIAWLPDLGGVDVLCLNLWIGRDRALTFSPEMVEEVCQFIARLRPGRVLFCHLYEVSRTPENGWTYVHAGLLQDRLLTLAPQVRCYAPYLGEGVSIR